MDELRSGERREGVYAALVTLFRKMSSAVAIFAVSMAIEGAGYLPPIEEIAGGATTLVEQTQSDQFVLVLRLIFAILPVVLLAISLYFAWRYPLTPKLHERLNRLLAARRAGEGETAAWKQEAQDLRQLLVDG